jgi:hypothetical protein
MIIIPRSEANHLSSDYVPDVAVLLKVECLVRNSQWCYSYLMMRS